MRIWVSIWIIIDFGHSGSYPFKPSFLVTSQWSRSDSQKTKSCWDTNRITCCGSDPQAFHKFYRHTSAETIIHQYIYIDINIYIYSMYIYIYYMYVCMYVYMYVCMYVFMYVCIYIYCMYVCMYLCMYVCIYIYILYVCMYVCMYLCMYVCMYVYIYILYVCMYVCMHACMHVCMYTCIHVYIYILTRINPQQIWTSGIYFWVFTKSHCAGCAGDLVEFLFSWSFVSGVHKRWYPKMDGLFSLFHGKSKNNIDDLGVPR